MSDAKALALAHPNKPWAKRWLRLHGSGWMAQVNPNNQTVRRIATVKRFVKGASTSIKEVP